MGYTPLPEHIFHTSPVKQVVATVLIAIFLGVGGAYAIHRATPVKKHTPAVVTTISPSKIPTALPTEEIQPTISQSCPMGEVKICEGGICECQKISQTQRTPIKCTTSSDCPAGAPCQNGMCIGIDYVLDVTNTPTCSPDKSTCSGDDHVIQQSSSTCPSGTVKVCQAGECECLPQ